MATAAQIATSPRGYSLRPSEIALSVEEYLHTVYQPDMDYVDGHLEERNLGEVEHSALQNALLTILNANARAWQIRVFPECRLQVRANRFRVPDIQVLPRSEKPEHIIRIAPLLCIEVLSPEDSFSRMQSRVDDYVAMGVKDIWVLDPVDSRVFTVAEGRQQFVEDRILTVAGTAIRVDLDQIKAELAD